MPSAMRLTPDSPVMVFLTPDPGVEPAHGSVVMTQGMTGTAWQRHFTDGLWHSTTGLVRNWAGLFPGTPGVSLLLEVRDFD